ncbi:MAG: GntR family transcriptional regulator [Oscillospiraceae bacterium]|nr:GntR family transcriptional regulator [Oscillospiraceae bacterium]MDD7042336.1 GntR family transcriptional regulator [Oscillospiraceae bacterium]MDY2611409.1 GntR family transcriptional regulator [Oscillospiraceae bacterium]
MNFSIEKNSTVSIYQQLINQVTRKVQNGELPSGKKLPTVRELADQLGIARGTVKHAYEELERKGIITMTRGKGTFIREQARQESSAKVRAMAAIERLLDEMESLSFSPQEIQMFFNLKMRERMERDDNVCIIFIDCNPETLANIINQISVLPNIEAHKLLLNNALKEPFVIDDFADLVITTSTHMNQLSSVVSNKEKLVQVVTAPSSPTVAKMAMIGGKSVGILCASETYSHIILRSMQNLELSCKNIETFLFGSAAHLDTFLRHKDVLIVPNDFLLFCSRTEGDLIRQADQLGKTVIRYNYQIDGGSFLNVQEKIDSIRASKYL